MKKPATLLKQIKGTRGAVAVYVAILLIVFIGFIALAVDIGYVMVVRNQLQNAADASALAGCNKFYYPPAPVTMPPFPDPYWQSAESAAAAAVSDNKADNKQLELGDIVTGYWDITQSSLGLRDKSTYTPTTNDGPAIQVAIAKTGAKNSGAILTFFAGILGIETVDMSAQATAVAASPGSVKTGALVPYAISEDTVEKFGLNEVFTIGTPYLNPEDAGQWTSFYLNTQKVPDIRTLLENGNQTTVTIGDNIFIQCGVKDNLYYQKQQTSMHNEYAGKDVFLPIIAEGVLDQTGMTVPVIGFIGFHVICAGDGCNEGPNLKIVRGYFTTAPNFGSGPIGPHYGPLDQCRLCQ